MSKPLENLYEEYIKFASEKIQQGASPMEVAAIMLTQALSFYKTAFTDEEYQQMMDQIYDKRNEVKTFAFDTRSLH